FPVHKCMYGCTLHCCMRLREAAALCSELVTEFVERRGPVAPAFCFAAETAIDRCYEILSWPITDLDPFRFSVWMQVWRVVFMIGIKAYLRATCRANARSFLPATNGASRAAVRRPAACAGTQ